MAKKNDWVQIHRVALEPADRSASLPEDTKNVPLEVWVKGYLLHDAEIGEEAEIVTRTGRKEKGRLVAVNPTYTHSFGDYIPELAVIGDSLREILFGEDKNDAL